MGIGPAIQVEAPTRAPLPYGLFSVLSPTTPTDPHWQLGAEWQPLECGPLRGIGDPSCQPGQTVGLPKVFDIGLLDANATAFTVYGEKECDPIGSSFAEIQDLASQRLLGGEQQAVERIVWTGEVGNTPSFDKSDAVQIGTAADPVHALALAEQFLGEQSAGQGVIHMPRLIATLLGTQYLTGSGSVLRTTLGTPVVAGGGYPNDGRIFTTGQMFGFRSEVFYSTNRPGDLLDRRTNDAYAVAERTYLVGFDPCPVGEVAVTV